MAPHGAGGLSSILPKVQIYLRDPFQRRKNTRNKIMGGKNVRAGDLGAVGAVVLHGLMLSF